MNVQKGQLRTNVFHENVLSHWNKAKRDVARQPRPAATQTRNTWLDLC
jgi:hypothetical protein